MLFSLFIYHNIFIIISNNHQSSHQLYLRKHSIATDRNEKAVLSQEWPRNAPYIWCHENFRDSLATPTATFPQILWAFVPMVQSERTLVSSYIGPPYILFIYQHSFARNFRLQFWVGVANKHRQGPIKKVLEGGVWHLGRRVALVRCVSDAPAAG